LTDQPVRSSIHRGDDEGGEHDGQVGVDGFAAVAVRAVAK
jgi:hypothetical protein